MMVGKRLQKNVSLTCHVTFLLGDNWTLKCGRLDDEDCFPIAASHQQNVIRRVVKHWAVGAVYSKSLHEIKISSPVKVALKSHPKAEYPKYKFLSEVFEKPRNVPQLVLALWPVWHETNWNATVVKVSLHSSVFSAECLSDGPLAAHNRSPIGTALSSSSEARCFHFIGLLFKDLRGDGIVTSYG